MEDDMKDFKKIVIILISVLLIILISGFGYVYNKLNSIYVKDDVKSDIKKSQEKEVYGITNILLVGTDWENIEKLNRSDSVMLVTIDNNKKDIKITSFARDTYVDIPGYLKN